MDNDNILNVSNQNINFKSRKLWVSIILLLTSIYFLWCDLGSITSLQWIEFIKWVFTIYVISNSVEKIIKKPSISNWKSKKLWGFLVLYILASIFTYFNKMSFVEWSELVKWIYGFYATSNVLSKVNNNIDIIPKR